MTGTTGRAATETGDLFHARRSGAVLAVALALAAPQLSAQEAPPAGTYVIDPSHTSVTFRVDHLGLSAFTAGFDEVSGTLDIDPADPGTARLEVRIGVGSLDLPAPPPGFLEEMLGPVWFDAGAHPDMVFVSDTIRVTGEATAVIEGTLTLRGATAPLEISAVFNAGFPPGVIEPHARLGFSGTAELDRSDWGMDVGVPPEGSTFGVGDRVRLTIEAEFIERR